MKHWRENLVRETWYGNRKPGILLHLAERAYFSAFRIHQAWQKRARAKDLDGKPVIVVGNLTAGGAGKTPFVIRLCEIAREEGFSAGVISRGYGRSGHAPCRVKADSDPRDSGDEPYLVASRTGLPVQVDSNREDAARALFDDGVNLVISDDGLQRARLPRRIEICIKDRDQGFGNGRLLPAGPLREPAERLEEVDYIVEHVPHGARTEASEGLTMQLVPGELTRLHSEETTTIQSLGQQQDSVHAVAGIANPERFFSTLKTLGLKTINHAFADHHRFSERDFETYSANDVIVMTEKDAVKCRKLPLINAWVLPVSAKFSEELETRLRQDLRIIAAETVKRAP